MSTTRVEVERLLRLDRAGLRDAEKDRDVGDVEVVEAGQGSVMPPSGSMSAARRYVREGTEERKSNATAAEVWGKEKEGVVVQIDRVEHPMAQFVA
jgi:hypothetical protein